MFLNSAPPPTIKTRNHIRGYIHTNSKSSIKANTADLNGLDKVLHELVVVGDEEVLVVSMFSLDSMCFTAIRICASWINFFLFFIIIIKTSERYQSYKKIIDISVLFFGLYKKQKKKKKKIVNSH